MFSEKELDPTRRLVLKGLGAAAVTGVAAGFGLHRYLDFTPDLPKALPIDILPEEELKKANITIYNSSKVKLFLRQSALNFPALNDAASGHNKGVIIALVDHGVLNWEASEKMVDIPKLIWTKTRIHPNQWTDTDWESEINKYRDLEKILKSGQGNSALQKLFGPDEIDPIIGQLIDKIEKRIPALRDPRTRIAGQISFENEDATNIGSASVISPKKSTFSGTLNNNINELISAHPNLAGKLAIFLAVSNEIRPVPKDSYPSPFAADLSSYFRKNKGYLVDFPDPGFALGHELSHYSSDQQLISETDADLGSLVAIANAWLRFRLLKDNSAYPFVFVTDEGITIAKKKASFIG